MGNQLKYLGGNKRCLPSTWVLVEKKTSCKVNRWSIFQSNINLQKSNKTRIENTYFVNYLMKICNLFNEDQSSIKSLLTTINQIVKWEAFI